MSRYFIELSYHGKAYHGWQRQMNAHSVQEEIEQKLSVLLRQPTEITGCGRTDTGVHARQYFAHFETETSINCNKLSFQLNATLPEDICIKQIFPVDPSFHARFDAVSRSYEYHIRASHSPFNRDLCWTYIRPLDLQAMNDAANLLLNHTDFECFSKVHTQVKTFECKVTSAYWEPQTEDLLVFHITADRFLRNMVRAIVGSLIEVGTGQLDKDGFNRILLSKNRCEAGQSVPAHGLFLTQVLYPPQAQA